MKLSESRTKAGHPSHHYNISFLMLHTHQQHRSRLPEQSKEMRTAITSFETGDAQMHKALPPFDTRTKVASARIVRQRAYRHLPTMTLPLVHLSVNILPHIPLVLQAISWGNRICMCAPRTSYFPSRSLQYAPSCHAMCSAVLDCIGTDMHWLRTK